MARGHGFHHTVVEVIGSATGTHDLGLPPTDPMTSRLPVSTVVRLGVVLVWALVASACSTGDDGDDGADGRETTVTTEPTPELAARADPLPVVTPTPRDMRWLGPDVVVSAAVTVVAGPDADPAAVDVITEALEGAGATDVTVSASGDSQDEAASAGDERPLTVVVGSAGDADVVARLRDAGVSGAG